MDQQQTEDLDFADATEMRQYIDALCANLTDKKLAKKVKKELLFKLRNEHGAVV